MTFLESEIDKHHAGFLQSSLDAFEHGPDSINTRLPSVVMPRPTPPLLSGEDHRLIGGSADNGLEKPD